MTITKKKIIKKIKKTITNNNTQKCVIISNHGGENYQKLQTGMVYKI